jgi:alpha-amylase/alpha-mannosidase (GH57 family)
MSRRYVCIHGHFYQPPRENPWLETVEAQESADPFHDWNERITAECYGPNAWARILDDAGYIQSIVSNYERISFNFGPTLLAWMERETPQAYGAILEAERASRFRFGGHSSALAQAYNHSILPLCNPADRHTQIRWGIADYTHRFGHAPRGMWLPETAVDTPTLEALAAEGIEFTLLAPHQAARVRLPGEPWEDVSGARVDPRRPYRCALPSGRSITLFFYDGPVSQAVAFEHLLDSGDRFADRLLGAFSNGDTELVHIATDGETYGHHHRHGDMALAYALRRFEQDPSVELTNYGAFLEAHPATAEVEIHERTSWSCAHGVERWKSDCGCSTGSNRGWNQRWRAPLREGLDWLAEQVAALYSRRASGLLRDPWAARNDYIALILERTDEATAAFFERHAVGKLTELQRIEALRLLEMQRHAMLMFTSCGWFFDDVSGIETTQIIRYAARAIQLAQEVSDVALQQPFVERLAQARSNLAEQGDGRQLYERHAAPLTVDLPRLVAHYAVSSLFTSYKPRAEVYAYAVEQLDYRTATLGRSRLALGKVAVVSQITREADELSFGFVHLGDHNMSGGVRAFRGDAEYDAMSRDVMKAFRSADMPEVLRLLDAHFGELKYSMRSLFRDEQQRVLELVVDSATTDAQEVSARLYNQHSPLLRYLATLDLPLPKPLKGLASFVLNTMLRAERSARELDPGRIRELMAEAEALKIDLHRVSHNFTLQRTVENATARWVDAPDRIARLHRVRVLADLARASPFDADLSHPQNEFYRLQLSALPVFRDIAAAGDEHAMQWCEEFRSLGEALRIRVPD